MQGLIWVLLLVAPLASCGRAPAQLVLDVRDVVTGEAVAKPQLVVDGAASATSTDEGSLRSPLPAGQHRILVQAQGYRSQSIELTIAERTAEQHRRIDLERRRIVGSASNARDGAPLVGVEVAMGPVGAMSDAQGTFALDARVLGDLTLHLDGYRPLTMTAAYLGTLFASDGEQASIFTAKLDPCGLNGSVTDASDGEPVARVTIASGTESVTTDATGRFALVCVPPGATIALSHPDYRPATLAYTGQLTAAIPLDPWQVALLVVAGDTQEPLGQARVRRTDDEWLTDKEGRATVRVAPGGELAVGHTGYFTQTLRVGPAMSQTVALEPSSLQLAVVAADTRQPITAGWALAYPVAGGQPERLALDEAGRVVLPDAGAYERVLLKVPGYERGEFDVQGADTAQVALAPFEARGLYVPFGLLTRPERLAGVLDLVQHSDELNAIVVDVKSDRAYLAWDSANPIARDTEGYISECLPLDEVIADCHARGIYVIARIVVFKDDLLAEAHPEWAVKCDDGSPYVDLEGLRWVDPFHPSVQDYNVALAIEVAEIGFDEVQLDYLRFPSDGSTKGNLYAQESTFETRTATMAAFCAQAYEAVSRTPAFLSADVFGLTVWVDPTRDMGIGQRVDDIAPYVDYLCPMLYPSTFGEGNLGFDHPVRYPYEVVYHSVLKTIKRTGTLVRPWLQAYSLADDYGPQEQLWQKKGAEDAGSLGWLFWNAGGKYDETVFARDAYRLLDPLPQPPQDEGSQDGQ
jgi:hypothetical protein